MRYFTSSLTGALLAACLALSTALSLEEPSQSSGKPFFEPFGLDLSALDKRTRPQDDFYQYVWCLDFAHHHSRRHGTSRSDRQPDAGPR
jgi:hypothetical protein